jgi:penicillin-binding protein 2
MLILDQLQKDDARLRMLGVAVVVGVVVLLGGLWRLQVMAAQRYSRSEEAQSVRLVRVPAVRGKILDRNGVAMAENRPSYDVNLYLEELRPWFTQEYTNRIIPAFREAHPGRRATSAERQQLQETARLTVYSNAVSRVASAVGTTLPVSAVRFQRHYRQSLALPLPVAENLTTEQMALFFERAYDLPGVDLEAQAVRTYPMGGMAAHVLGHLTRADEADNDPDTLLFRYRLRDYRGVAGIEGRYDEVLRGRAGVKALRVNSQGYRHEETILQPTEAGRSVRLTLDWGLQWVAERALRRIAGPSTRGAVVVMDVHSGDVLALVSSPAFDPNEFLGGLTPERFAELNDDKLRPQMNRAIAGAYPPGSIFKIVVALAALEAGVLDPLRSHTYQGYWSWPGGGVPIDDTAPPGDYNFVRALKRSSNAYFIDHGLKTGRSAIVSMSERLGLGTATGGGVGVEAPGYLPDEAHLARLRSRREAWTEGNTALLSIGQDALTTSPLQIAVMLSAVANGGRVLEPRLVDRIESASGEVLEQKPIRVRSHAKIAPRHLDLLREAMRANVEDVEGTGREAAVAGWRVCGKTGTAEVKRGRTLVDKITWFVAFGPFESPRYATVVVVESGVSGGRTAAPVAKQIFESIRDREAGAHQRVEPAVGGVGMGETMGGGVG